MILHIFHKGNSFTKHGIQCFESAGISSHYLVPPTSESATPTSNKNILSITINSKEYKQLIKSKLSNYKLIVFHGLLGSNKSVLKDVLKISGHPKTAWIIYGGEMTEAAICPSKFLGPKTTITYYKIAPYRLLFPITRLFSRIFGISIFNLLRRIDYFSHFMSEEIDVCNIQLKSKKPSLWFSYVMLENYIGSEFINQKAVTEGNILIGNSASFTSNHTEIFLKIQKVKIDNKKVIVPLNYGNQSYKKHINIIGNKLLGNNFEPINELMSSTEYNKTLLSCSCMILNHNRQQALGNIITALWLGMKVYINGSISTYKFFKSQGVIIFSINDDFEPIKNETFRSLSVNETLHNRKALIEIFSSEKFLNRLNNSFAHLID